MLVIRPHMNTRLEFSGTALHANVSNNSAKTKEHLHRRYGGYRAGGISPPCNSATKPHSLVGSTVCSHPTNRMYKA